MVSQLDPWLLLRGIAHHKHRSQNMCYIHSWLQHKIYLEVETISWIWGTHMTRAKMGENLHLFMVDFVVKEVKQIRPSHHIWKQGVIPKIRAKWSMAIIGDTANPNATLCPFSNWTYNWHIKYPANWLQCPSSINSDYLHKMWGNLFLNQEAIILVMKIIWLKPLDILNLNVLHGIMEHLRMCQGVSQRAIY